MWNTSGWIPSAVRAFTPPIPRHDFLAHAHLEIAAVKLRGDASVLRVVLRNVGVEEIDIHAPDAQFPNPGENFSIENRDRNEKLHFASASFADRQVVKILVQVNCCLNAVLIDLLPEIAVAIEQTNRHKIQIEIARRFAMIAGQNAEAAGVIRIDS
jgi:hypothetical protein